ncbi:TldD/PmbA family protein [Candidatus Caldatribacterium sp. SIUC1]|uniref:TldD/PmbA family protein n=1 Tax=Candidatus Caldatribacterium sp. SIUC1 TaxID=3418365 RepID=UPI003F692F59
MREILRDLVRKPQNGEYLEIRLEHIVTTSIRIHNTTVERLKVTEERGGSLRILHPKTGWWFVSFQGWDSLKEHVASGLRSVVLLPQSGTGVIRGEGTEEEIRFSPREDFREKPLGEKVQLLFAYARMLREASPFVVSAVVEYRDEWRTVYFANSDGSVIFWERPDISLSFVATARKGDQIEVYRDGVAGKAGFELVRGLEELAHRVGKQAEALLFARPFPGGVYDVILDPVLAGVFIHEAFGHLSEADFLSRNERLQRLMVLGKPIASPVLSVFDDGSLENLRGSSPYDDEGTRTQRTCLIREGYLSGRLHSRETAFLLGESPTGNARTISYRFPPIVRMTNTGIEPGTVPPEDLFADIKRGVYAVEYVGGSTALELFTFSPAYGYLIEGGKVGEMVKDIVLSGNLFQTLGKIDAVANDFRWTEVGWCGKGEQMGLPTPTGSPHVRLREVLVGGQCHA